MKQAITVKQAITTAVRAAPAAWKATSNRRKLSLAALALAVAALLPVGTSAAYIPYRLPCGGNGCEIQFGAFGGIHEQALFMTNPANADFHAGYREFAFTAARWTSSGCKPLYAKRFTFAQPLVVAPHSSRRLLIRVKLPQDIPIATAWYGGASGVLLVSMGYATIPEINQCTHPDRVAAPRAR